MCSALQYYDFSLTKSSYHAKNIAFDKYNWITLFFWAMMPHILHGCGGTVTGLQLYILKEWSVDKDS